MGSRLADGTQFQIDTGSPGAEEWDDLVAKCPWGSFYHGYDNLNMIRHLLGVEPRYLLLREGERLIGGLAWCEKEGPAGTVANALPFYGSYGEALALPNLPDDAIILLYQTFLDGCRDRDVVAATIITSPFAERDRTEWHIESLSPDIIDNRLCQMTSLPDCRGLCRPEAEKRVLNVLRGSARRAVRKARKEGVSVRPAASLDEVRIVANLHADNIDGKGGLSKPLSFFRFAWQLQQAPTSQAVVLVAEWHGKIIGGVVMFETNDTLEYHTTGMDMEHSNTRPTNAIVFGAMVDGSIRGLRYINFGGTWKTQEGIHRFKASFGAEDRDYQYLTWLFDPTLLHQTAEQLAADYPGFFVVPYSALDGTT